MKLSSVFPRGMSACDLLPAYLDVHQAIQALRLVVYSPSSPLSDRLAEAGGASSASRAETEGNYPANPQASTRFANVIAGLDQPWESKGLAQQMLLHETHHRHEVMLHRGDAMAEAIGRIVEDATTDFVVGVNSLVRVASDVVCHIPMIDFRCSPTAVTLDFVKTALRQIGQRRGVILESGRSFHYYGLDLLAADEWRPFLGKCLLLTPLVDVRYVAHRLIDGYGVLRISSNRRKPKVPTVVDVLDNGPSVG